MYSERREDMRDVFFAAWDKYRAGKPLSGNEALIVEVALEHPEFQPVLEDPKIHRDRDFPESGGANPFFHMGLHIAVAEQIALDRPAGVRAVYEALCARRRQAHAAQHAIMECLAAWLRQAHSSADLPGEDEYLASLRRLLSTP